jgi:4-oxalocrotonate tautomerase family enzyme
MALARIETAEPWSTDRRAAAMEGVRSAISTTLRVPLDDATVILDAHDETTLTVPRGMSRGYTLVTVTMFAGRSGEAKRELVQAITNAVADCGVPHGEVDVVIQEQPQAHWARGGILASEREHDFKVEI